MTEENKSNASTNGVQLDEVLSRFLSDEALQDLTLEGTDGVQVRANRCVLSARSQVFRKMLLGGFNEAFKDVVKLGYEGIVLKAIVEFVHTDSAEILNGKKRNADNDENSVSTATIATLVAMDAAAKYFHLPGLTKKVKECLDQYLKEKPSLCFVFLEACRAEGPAISEDLSEMALWRIRSTSPKKNDADIIAILSASVLEEVLTDEYLKTSEAELFEMLQWWVQANPTERKTKGMELAKHICLWRIKPSILASTVESSGLVTLAELCEAYKMQALQGEEHNHIDFQQHRYKPVWKGSQSDTATNSTSEWKRELLNFPPMKSGLYEWTMEVKPGSTRGADVIDTARIGIFLPDNLGNNPSYCYYETTNKKETFRLDLRPDNEHNGCFFVSSDGPFDPEDAVLELREKMEKPRGIEGYAPSVDTRNSAAVRLVSIERLED